MGAAGAPPPTSPLVAYTCMLVWMVLSAGVILINKWILDPSLGGFPYPLTLTACHMAFCSAASAALVRAGLFESPPPVQLDLYLRAVAPVGALFALTLWLGNASFVLLSVPLIQMLKALTPLAVYTIGCAMGTEKLSWRTSANLAVVVAGVITATMGETRFMLLGVLMQLASIAAEGMRLALVQVLLQGADLRLTPLSTMYYVAPVSFVCLLAPLAGLEVPQLTRSPAAWGRVGPAVLLGSAAAAFLLNLSLLVLVSRTSALTLNLAGITKDCTLVALSMVLFGTDVAPLQLAGYSVALAGVAAYNRARLHARPPAAGQGAKGGLGAGGAGGGEGAADGSVSTAGAANGHAAAEASPANGDAAFHAPSQAAETAQGTGGASSI